MKGALAQAALDSRRIAARSLRMSGFRAQIGAIGVGRDPAHPDGSRRGRLPQGASGRSRELHRVGGHLRLRALDSGSAPISPRNPVLPALTGPVSGGDPPAGPTRAEARKRQKSLDFEGSIRHTFELSEFTLPPRHIRSKITVRPNDVSPIPACCAHPPTAHPQLQLTAGAIRGGSPEISKKTLETGSLRAVSDTKVRSHTGGPRNF